MMTVYSKCYSPMGVWKGLGRIHTPGVGLGRIHTPGVGLGRISGRSQTTRQVLVRNLNIRTFPHSGSILTLGARKEKELFGNGNSFRYFRWDAKPDNVFGQSFRQGLNKRAHPLFLALMAIFLIPFFNWKEFFSKDSYVPKIVQYMFLVLSGGDRNYEYLQENNMSSSLAAEVYDKYGDEGLAAMKKAWEETRDMPGSSDQKAVHAIMMAQAAVRYKKEVIEEAEKLGLDKDEVMKELISEPVLQTGTVGGKAVVAPPSGRFGVKAEESKSNWFGLKAEEELVEETLLEFEEKRHENKVGFRDRKIIEYENRVRHYSTPDKVFRYFATYKLTDDKDHSEVMMTPEDFLRSISPGEKQPDHLGLDQFIQVGLESIGDISPLQTVDRSSIFYQLGSGGLISFSDYIFLLTVLSTSRRHFQIAFKMFDLNGDGTVDAEEFEKVTTLLRSTSSTGARHRDHGVTGSTFKGINSGLITFFFGKEKKGTLTVERFLDFQRRLQEEILELEFRKKGGQENGTISERDFAELLIAYAGFTSKKKTKMLRRVRKIYSDDASLGITLKDYLNFYQVLFSINDIDIALTYHTIAGAPIERATMKHVARTVAHVDLSDHLVDVVFNLFDDNGDGKLSNKEFVSVMKQRAMRGLEKPKEIGISRVFTSIFKCAADCRPAVIGGVRRTE
ncbi:calcium uptake protein 1 homolog, mitochondrial isoform X4 [Eurytemora carolleeae]|uniref:calcium uptake protein 1 homolog, mitochondrial isoform X4 n=1 Tax=Eurytemora carolleeae TaxID=1294199 RepID=UPI000C778C59|nr:calcium uptake protein 1 homolog, mitochondrial isoform X4 [Eurytemora carolleeae]|eukprot:XP_023334803.1 calcium uptake protein 1 homolog, mitochondrial-like isoform X4 [Eurytemora affinis]